MGLNPWYVGMTGKVIQIPLNTDSGPDNISGLVPSNFTMIIQTQPQNAPTGDITGTGTFFINSSNPAVVWYSPASADVASAGNMNLVVKAQFPTGPVYYDPIAFTIKAV